MMRKYLTLFLILGTTIVTAQEAMRVVRCDAVSNRASIQNVFIDEENRKWVGNEEGVFEVLDMALGEAITVADGNIALFSVPGGNSPLQINKAKLEQLIGLQINEENELTAAYYRPARKELWLGTSTAGAYRLRADEGELKLLDSYTSKNSKLKSDQINTIFVDPFGRIWMGTNDGVFYGKDKKWDLDERYFNFTQIDIDTTNRIWMLADDLLGYMNRKQVWTPVDLPEDALDGPIIDFTFDNAGYLWVVTEIVARINIDTDEYDIYGPAQYYTSQYATQIASDLDGAIWVATEDKGLFLVESAAAMTVNVLLEKGLDCDQVGNTAALSVRVTGGFEPYTYTWAEDKASGANPTGLGQGTYIVTVTDNRGTEKIAKAEITDPTVLAEAQMLEKESGLNENDGKAEVSVTQGLAPFTYAWDNGERTQQAIQLGEGSHEVTVTDANGCEAIATVEVERIIGALSAAINTEGEIKCFGEKTINLEVETAGGKGPFTYEWNTGATSPALAGVGAGTYEVTITDAIGNQTAADIAVEQPVEFKASIDVISPPSVAARDGVAAVVLEGGKGPFIYKWNYRGNRDTIRELSAGPLAVTVTDVSACTATAEATLQENILELNAEIVYAQKIQCFGQPAADFEVVPKGGKGPYQFEWAESTISGNTGLDQFAGDYSVTITDGVGQSFVKNFTIPQPDELELSPEITTPASANGSDGEAKINVQGGTAPFIFKWSNGYNQEVGKALAADSYTVTVTDANACEAIARFEMTENILPLQAKLIVEGEIECGGEAMGIASIETEGGKSPYTYKWNDGRSEQRRTDLREGLNFVTVTDAAENAVPLRVKLDAPPVLGAKVVNTAPTSTDQEDGKATIEIEGGRMPYSIKWESGETEPAAVALATGEQKVVVTDSAGCITEVTFSLDENVLPLSASVTLQKSLTCNGDSDAALQVEHKDGKGPFTYQWSVDGGSDKVAANLAAGEYTVTVTDAIGQTASAAYTITDPAVLTATVTRSFPPSQNNKSDGYAYVEVQGGVTPYQFKWDSGETTQEALRLNVGAHTVEVIDTNGCRVNAATEVDETLIPGLSITNIVLDEPIPLVNIKFDPDSTTLKEEFHPVMEQLYKFMAYKPGASIEIGGHTNNLPPDEYCDKISRARAKSTADYLLKNKQIPIFRVFYRGYGKREPIADNDTAEGRARNQRVELKIVSNRETNTGSQ